jgi:hypothetical protein
VPLRDAIARAGGFRISDGFISPLDLVEIGLSVAGAGLHALAVELVQAALLARASRRPARCRRRASSASEWPSVCLTSARMIVTCSAFGGSV